MVQLRKNLTENMESKAGKVHFRRWKAMSIGARISLIVLTLVVLIAALANFIAPHDPLQIFRPPMPSSSSAPTTRVATCSPA